ncbi:hypothetical protein L1987_03747 [Smallanthus sonchifolius]|uniref:Uncharacterized protein n=1 Tax=Smallanthus sonchifolius TaxID=185202 RepID=A0ACB9KBF9_9ASTR|nr:hypothetical protein L1987_03747 [Smallanthus sonchifolius]
MAKKLVKYSVVDAFTDNAFKGNPAAVCWLEDTVKDDKWLQSVATEFNLPTTGYLTPIVDHGSQNPRFHLRWFTPASEPLTFFSDNKINGESHDSFYIELDFPVVPVSDFNDLDASAVSEMLNGVAVVDVLKKNAYNDIIVVLLSGEEVADLKPRFDKIKEASGRGIIITAPAPKGSGFDFYSRFFCPKYGVDEDPVCGSAHCALVTYWHEKLGKCEFVAYQASRRSGILHVHLDKQHQRVLLRGKATTVMEGSILV